MAGAVLLVALVLGLHLALEFILGRTLAGEAVDTDSYARLIRVRELWAGAAWTDPVTPSFSAPEGLFLHWTRPLDVIILVPAWLLAALAGLPRDQAVFVAGVLACPLLHAATALVAVWAARAAWPRGDAWLAGLLVAFSLTLLGYSMAGRADHHTLVALAGAACLGAGLRALRGRRPAGMAWLCGAAGGFGLWVSPEAQLAIVPMLAGFGAAFLTGPGPRTAALQGARAAAGAAGLVAVAILVERGPAGAGLVAYDLVALPHLAMTGAALLVLAGCACLAGGAGRRLAVALPASAAVLVLLVLAFPGLPRASMADAGPAAARLFLPLVWELRPLDFGSPAAVLRSVALLGGATPAALVVLMAVAPRWWRGPRRVLLAPLALLLLLNIAAAIGARRFAVDLAVPAAVVAAGLPLLLGRWLAARPASALFGRAGAVVAMLVLPLLAPPDAKAPMADPAIVSCEAAPLARWLAATLPPATERPILLNLDGNAGPALAWFAPVRVVAGPYHRGEAAFADTQRVREAASLADVEAVLRRRQAGFLLACRADRDGLGPAVSALLDAEAPPPWLSPVALPEGLAARFALWRVE